MDDEEAVARNPATTRSTDPTPPDDNLAAAREAVRLLKVDARHSEDLIAIVYAELSRATITTRPLALAKTIARRRFFDMLRSEEAHRSTRSLSEIEPAVSDHAQHTPELDVELERILRVLSEEERALLVKRVHEGRTIRELALEATVPESTMRSRSAAVLLKLFTQLQRSASEIPEVRKQLERLGVDLKARFNARG